MLWLGSRKKNEKTHKAYWIKSSIVVDWLQDISTMWKSQLSSIRLVYFNWGWHYFLLFTENRNSLLQKTLSLWIRAFERKHQLCHYLTYRLSATENIRADTCIGLERNHKNHSAEFCPHVTEHFIYAEDFGKQNNATLQQSDYNV